MRLNPSLIAIALSDMTCLASSDIYTPSMPSIAAGFGVSSSAVQGTITLFMLGSILAAFSTGLICAYIGEKKAMLCGLVVGIVGIAICVFSHSLSWMLFGRFLQGAGLAIGPVVGYSVLQESTDRREVVRNIAVLGVILIFVPSFAPALGGFIAQHMHWRHTFSILLCMGFLSFLLVLCFVRPDSRRGKDVRFGETLKIYGKLLTSHRYLAYALFTPLVYGVEWALLSVLPFYMHHHFEFQPDQYGLFLAAIALPGMLAPKIFVWGHEKKGSDWCLSVLLIALGVFCAGFVFVSIWFGKSLLFISALLIFYYFIGGGAFTISIERALDVFPEHRSIASSMRSTMVVVAASSSAFYAELMPDDTLVWSALFMAGVGVILAITYLTRPATP